MIASTSSTVSERARTGALQARVVEEMNVAETRVVPNWHEKNGLRMVTFTKPRPVMVTRELLVDGEPRGKISRMPGML